MALPSAPADDRTDVIEQAIDMVARSGGDALISPMWGPEPPKGCRCPKGQDCPTPAKHGPAQKVGKQLLSWKELATNEVSLIETRLKNGGTPNYGVVPTNDLFIIDADGEDVLLYANFVKSLGLGQTFTVKTANGFHIYWRLPDDVRDAPARLFIAPGHSLVVRSAAHPGYVLGPGSVHASGSPYYVSRDVDIAIIPSEALRLSRMTETSTSASPATAPLLGSVPPTGGALITLGEGGGYELPERIETNTRYPEMVRYVAHLYNRGFDEATMWSLVQTELAPRFVDAKEPKVLEADFQRAVKGMAEKLGPPASAKSAIATDDPVAARAKVIEVGHIWLSARDYIATNSAAPEWCSPLAVFGGVSLIAGPPKAGKSTLLAGLLWARTNGGVFLWGEPVPQGPTLYVTEEAGVSVSMKLDSELDLDVIDMPTYRLAGLSSRAHLLALIEQWCESKAGLGSPMVLIDTFAIWSGIKDENDSVDTTKAVSDLKALATGRHIAMPVVAHTRKGGGESGEAIRGSSAIFGSTDISIEFRYTQRGQADDGRELHISGRYESPSRHVLDYDRADGSYAVGVGVSVADELKLGEFPSPMSGDPGLTVAEMSTLWGIGAGAALNKANGLVSKGVLVKELVKVPGGRVTRNEYWAPVLLSVDPASSGSVSGRMSDIFHAGSEDPS